MSLFYSFSASHLVPQSIDVTEQPHITRVYVCRLSKMAITASMVVTIGCLWGQRCVRYVLLGKAVVIVTVDVSNISPTFDQHWWRETCVTLCDVQCYIPQTCIKLTEYLPLVRTILWSVDMYILTL